MAFLKGIIHFLNQYMYMFRVQGIRGGETSLHVGADKNAKLGKRGTVTAGHVAGMDQTGQVVFWGPPF